MNFKKILMGLAILFLATGFISAAAASDDDDNGVYFNNNGTIVNCNITPNGIQGYDIRLDDKVGLLGKKAGLDQLAAWMGSHYTYNDTKNSSIAGGFRPDGYYGDQGNAALLVKKVLDFNGYDCKVVTINYDSMDTIDTIPDKKLVEVDLCENGFHEVYGIDPSLAFENPLVSNPTTDWYTGDPARYSSNWPF